MKRIISLTLAMIYLTACNDGTNNQIRDFNNSTTPLQAALNKSLKENTTNLVPTVYSSTAISSKNSFLLFASSKIY